MSRRRQLLIVAAARIAAMGAGGCLLWWWNVDEDLEVWRTGPPPHRWAVWMRQETLWRDEGLERRPRHIYAPLEDISIDLQLAVLVSEDINFFGHGAVGIIPRSFAQGYDEADRRMLRDIYAACGKPIELNPLIMGLLTDRPGFKDYTGLNGLNGMTFHVDEARSWFARSTERFDIIQMSLTDTWAATGAGAYTLSENGL